jgi:nucleotide-binding universal stress UspA family protein
VHALYVVDLRAVSGSAPALDAGRLREALETEGQSVTDRIADRAADRDVSVVKAVHDGIPVDEIEEYTADHDIDLVVMGTHGRRGANRLLIGSVAEEVVRSASCPVLTIRADEKVAPGEAVRRILVPVDFSDVSNRAIQHAKELAMTYGARLDLLHVVEEIALPAAYGMEPVNLVIPEVVENSERALADMAREEIGYEHIVVHALTGYAVSTILDFADENDIDLMVIATHGRTGIDRVLMGSVAEKVVRRAPCPVFTVKSFGKSLVPSEKKVASTDQESS